MFDAMTIGALSHTKALFGEEGDDVFSISAKAKDELLGLLSESEEWDGRGREVQIHGRVKAIIDIEGRVLGIKERGVVDCHLDHVDHIKPFAVFVFGNPHELKDDLIHPFSLTIGLRVEGGGEGEMNER